MASKFPTKRVPARQPMRPHHIQEWAEKFNLSRVTDLAKALGVNKSVVTRWFQGTSPSEEMQQRLAELFYCEPESLFRHPEEYWLADFLAGRDQDEIGRIKATLEAAFPKSAKGSS